MAFSKIEIILNRFSLLSFIVPFVYRLLLELYAYPFALGYDVMAFYVPFLLGYAELSPLRLYATAPLYYLALHAMYGLTGDPIVAVKVVAVLLEGFLGFALYMWGFVVFKSRVKALIFSLLTSFYFIILRLSWDLHRNVLGLSLALLMLSVVYGWWSFKVRSSLSLSLAVLTALAHQLCPLILVSALLPRILRRCRLSIAVASVSLVFWLSIVYASSIASSRGLYNQLLSYLALLAPSIEQLFPVGLSALEFLAYAVMPLIPFLAYSIMRGIKQRCDFRFLLPAFSWLAFCIVMTPFMSFGYRFVLLAPIPIIMMTTAFSGKKVTMALSAIVLMLGLGYTLCSAYSPFPYFNEPIMWRQEFKYAIPTSILQNTVPLEDSPSLARIMKTATSIAYSRAKSIFLISRPMLGYALLSGLPKDKIVVYGDPIERNSSIMASYLKEGYEVYLVWWMQGYKWYGAEINDIVDGHAYSITYCEEPFALYLIER